MLAMIRCSHSMSPETRHSAPMNRRHAGDGYWRSDASGSVNQHNRKKRAGRKALGRSREPVH